MTDVFVIADAHGRHDLVRGLLRQEGLLNGRDVLDRTGPKVVQIGDLCNCVSSSIDADRECLKRAPDWFDVYLVGNHEHPYFDGPAFSGFWRDPEIRELLLRYAARGLMRPCLAVGDILVTHAGLTSRWGGLVETAAEAEDWLTKEWESRRTALVFSAISRTRGGFDRSGGVLWADWSEPKRMAFSQLVGHTAGDEIRSRGRSQHRAVCIDLGAGHNDRIAGAWIRDGKIEVVIHGD